MPVMIKCRKPGCPARRSLKLYKGKEYCSAHYQEKLEGEFSDLYDKWLSCLQSEEHLRSLMGRMLDEFWQIEGGMMTKAKLRDRAYNFRKTRKVFTFEIIRHPRAFMSGMVENRVVQKWRADISEGVVTLVSERDWLVGDIDR